MRVFPWLPVVVLAAVGVSLGQEPVASAESTRPPDTEAAAENSTNPKDAFPLRAIRIEGNQNFSSDEIIALSELKFGQIVQPIDFERALEKINQAGGFQSLEFRYGPHGDGYEVIYTVEEVEDLYPVRFDGFGVPEEEIRELLGEKVPLFGPRVPATGPIIDRIGDTLQAFWNGLGNESEVTGRLLPASGGEFEMVFQPEGAVKTIALTKFENTDVLSALELQRVFHNVAAGVPYTEKRLLELLEYNITPLYEEKGRLEVKFCPCRAEPDEDTAGVVVTIHVEEGAEYTFGEVQLPESMETGQDKLERLVKFKTGDRADMTRVVDTVGAIENLFRANGYMNASVEFTKTLDREKKTADVAIQAEAGDRYSFKSLTIKGLDLIGEAAVRKRWGMNVGDPFNASYPGVFLSRVRADGMFDNLSDTGWSIQVNENDKTVDVELTFK